LIEFVNVIPLGRLDCSAKENEPVVSKKVRDRSKEWSRILQVFCQHCCNDSLIPATRTRLSDVKGIFDLKSDPMVMPGDSEKAVCNRNCRGANVDTFKPYVRPFFCCQQSKNSMT
jgi:hypothetical protein